MLGCNGNVYNAADYGSSFSVNSIQAEGTSNSSSKNYHEHRYGLYVKAYNESYSSYKYVSVSREFNFAKGTNASSGVIPSTYVNGSYTGRYFEKTQQLKVIIKTWSNYELYTLEHLEVVD